SGPQSLGGFPPDYRRKLGFVPCGPATASSRLNSIAQSAISNGYVCILGEALYTSSSPAGGWKIVMYLSISALGISNAPSGRFRFRSSKRRYNSEYGTSI